MNSLYFLLATDFFLKTFQVWSSKILLKNVEDERKREKNECQNDGTFDRPQWHERKRTLCNVISRVRNFVQTIAVAYFKGQSEMNEFNVKRVVRCSA